MRWEITNRNRGNPGTPYQMRLHAPFWCSAERRKASGGGTREEGSMPPNLGCTGLQGAVNEPAGGGRRKRGGGRRLLAAPFFRV